jgi:hypothetical protein
LAASNILPSRLRGRRLSPDGKRFRSGTQPFPIKPEPGTICVLTFTSSDQTWLGEGRSLTESLPPLSQTRRKRDSRRLDVAIEQVFAFIAAAFCHKTGRKSHLTAYRSSCNRASHFLDTMMCETDIALAVLLLFGPMWLGEQAVVKSSLKICQSFLGTVLRGLTGDVQDGQLVSPTSFPDGRRSIGSIGVPRRDPSSSPVAAVTPGKDDLSGSSRSRKSVRFHSSPPVELRRGFRRARAERPSSPPPPTSQDEPATTAPPSPAATATHSVQPTLSGCRRTVAASLRQSRPRILARRAKVGTVDNCHTDSASSATTTSTTTTTSTSSFMASFKLSR